ncbi:hypothetical protein [Methylacidiphilum kamchatkense]|uniref:hypothetical protein n=1 Tax=Methylacidiphilum kamchatkense TaxID=431057 RepID=UPI000B331EAE|nr:hypothetical protein [Methylacidiphilum kamchatkense]
MDLSPELVLITGLVAGFIHALTGPDHLSAIAPLAIESRKAAWKIGLFWGLGHSGGIWILAVILFFFVTSSRSLSFHGGRKKRLGLS